MNKQLTLKSALPIHYGVFDLFTPLGNFFNMLLMGVALGHAPILTKFMVKQAEFSLVNFFFLNLKLFFQCQVVQGIFSDLFHMSICFFSVTLFFILSLFFLCFSLCRNILLMPYTSLPLFNN